MCQSKLHPLLQALPKCEHHVHLEGTLTPEYLFARAAHNSIGLPSDDPAFASVSALQARYERFTSLDDFLHYYFIGFSVLVTAADFEELTFQYLTRAYAENVRHAELFFDPQVHTLRGVKYETIVNGMSAARDRASTVFRDLSVLFIPCHVRHLPISAAFEMIKDISDAGHFADGTVTGLGMSSTEIGMHPSKFEAFYAAAREAGVTNLTAHAGEEGPAEYVSAALSELGVGRIDHGRRAIEDATLVRKLAEDKTLLTLCPISNVVLRGISDVKELPIREFLEAGVPFSLNSDDPAYFGGWIQDNYCAVQEAFELGVGEWETIAKGSIYGSWCTEQRKQELVEMVDVVLQDWKA